MAKIQKSRHGRFVIFHVGKMAYTVEVDGEVVYRARSYGEASSRAFRLYEAERIQIRSEG